MESGKWEVESGKWKVESGQWKVENWHTDAIFPSFILQRDNTLTYIFWAGSITMFIHPMLMPENIFRVLDRSNLVPRIGSFLEQETSGMNVRERNEVIREKIADLQRRSDMPGSEGDNLMFAALELREALSSLS